MNCPACGRPASENESHCTACGAALVGPDDATRRDDATMTGLSGPVTGTTAARLSLGASLGTRYEIQALLGQGGMGAVYKAHDRELDRTVAIKVIRADMVQNLAVLERFKREIILASKVTHRNVLRIHDFGEAGDVKYISMNYVDGESLTALLAREGPLSVERALPLVRQIGEALEAAHQAGVVHRDLKPQNILIDREGNAYIADFGISRSMESGGTITEAGSVIGTVDYMAPEQARGEKTDPRGDQYSFGVILYVMLTGRLPFGGGDALSVMMKRLHEAPPAVRKVRPELPAWISEIVARAMQRDPADRYASVAALLRDIDARRAATPWRKIRRRVLLPAAVVLAIAAVVYGGIRFWRSRPQGPAAPITALVVLPFQNATGDPRYDWAKDGLPSLLRDDLVQARDLRVAGQDRVRDVLNSLNVHDGEESRAATMRKIAAMIGADHVLAGKLLKIGGKLRVEAVVQRAGTQDSTAPPLIVDGEGDNAIPTMLGQLAPRIWESIGVSRGWIERARSDTRPSSHSAEALTLHGQALGLIRAGRFLDASQRLEAAVQKDPGFALAHALLAETYEKLGYSDKAAAEAKLAAAGIGSASAYEAARIQATLARLDGDLEAAEKAYGALCEITPADAEAYFDLASVRQQRGNLPGALEAYRRVVALDPKYPNAHMALGRVLFNLGNSTEAIQELNVALRLHEENGNDEGRGLVLNGLGNLYLGSGQYDEALSRFESALAIRRKIGDLKGVRTSLTNVALIQARQGRFEASIKAAEEAVAIARQIGDRGGLANTLSELGDDYQTAAQPENAMKAYQESLKIFRERGMNLPADEARALDNLANANTLLGRSVEALYSLKDALAKRREIGDKAEIIRSLSDIGDNQRLQGGYGEALKYYTEGLKLARDTDDQTYVMAFLASLAAVHEEQGEYGAALASIAEGEPLARDAKDDGMIAAFLTETSAVRRHIGDHAAAATALEEAMKLARATSNIRLQAEILTSTAHLHLAHGERAAAAASAAQALSIAKPVGEPGMILRVRLAADEAAGAVEDAGAVVKEAESAGLMPVAAAAALTQARLHLAAKRQPAALRSADQAGATAGDLGQADVLFQAHLIAAQALAAQGDGARAAERLAAGLGPLEDMRVGLRDAALKSFVSRPETAAYAKQAQDAFRAAGRTQDAERLQRLLQP